jgi:hypothetical protein
MMKVFSIVIIIGFCCLGCGKKAEQYGEVPTTSRTPISSILVSPQEYMSKEVVITGVITSECPSGGWIVVEEASGHRIYVDMHGSTFAPIPQRVGETVVVKGIVFQGSGRAKEVKLIGKGVLIKR